MNSKLINFLLCITLMASSLAFGSAAQTTAAAAAGAAATESPLMAAIKSGELHKVEKHLADVPSAELKQASTVAQECCKADKENPFRKQILKVILEKQFGQPKKADEQTIDGKFKFTLPVSAAPAKQPALTEAQALGLAIAARKKLNQKDSDKRGAAKPYDRQTDAQYLKGVDMSREQLVEALEQRTLDLSKKYGQKKRTLAMLAARKDDKQLLALIIPQMSERQLKLQDAEGDNIVTFVCSICDAQMVGELLGHPSVQRMVDERNRDGNTALHETVKDDMYAETAALLCCGANVNARRRKDDWTPLMISVYTNNPSLTELLITHKANPSLVVNEDITALGLAETAVENSVFDDNEYTEAEKINNNEAIIQLLSHHTARVENESKRNLKQLMKASDREENQSIEKLKDKIAESFMRAQRMIDSSKVVYIDLIVLLSAHRRWPLIQRVTRLPNNDQSNLVQIVRDYAEPTLTLAQHKELRRQTYPVLKNMMLGYALKKGYTEQYATLHDLTSKAKPKAKKNQTAID